MSGRVESRHPRRWLPWILAASVLASFIATLLIARTDTGAGFAPELPSVLGVIPFMLAGAFAVIGGLIVRTHRHHAIGWLFVWFSVMLATGVLLDTYAFREPPLPAREWVAVWSAVGFFFYVVPLVTLLPLLFPDGRMPSRRWRTPLVVAAAGFVLIVAGSLLDPALLHREGSVGLDNPLVVETLTPWVPRILLAGLLPLGVFAIAAIADLVVRFRRSTGVRRLQMRWLAFGAGATFVGVVGQLVSYFVFGSIEVAVLSFTLGALALPVSIGVAILRFRLFDIDRVISRTVTFAVLTLILVGVYVAGVVGVGRALQGLTGGAGGDLVVAATTLVVAALFQPVRRRIQRLVDRRFNRARYDASREVERFGARLRDEVDLASLAEDLRLVLDETVHPRSVGLWLPEEAVR